MLHLLTITILNLLPAVALAQDFVPLVGIPFVDTSKDLTLGDYVNGLYLAAISIAAFLAVVKIIFAGVQYMLSEVVTDKAQAKKSIYGAIIGLLIVLGAFLILNTINPNLTNLTNLDGPTLQTEGGNTNVKFVDGKSGGPITGPEDCADNETFGLSNTNAGVVRTCTPNETADSGIIKGNLADADREFIEAICGTDGTNCTVETLDIPDSLPCLVDNPDDSTCIVYNTDITISNCENKNGRGVQNPSNPAQILCYTSNDSVEIDDTDLQLNESTQESSPNVITYTDSGGETIEIDTNTTYTINEPAISEANIPAGEFHNQSGNIVSVQSNRPEDIDNPDTPQLETSIGFLLFEIQLDNGESIFMPCGLIQPQPPGC